MNAMRLSQTTRLYVGIWLTGAMCMGALLGFAEYRRNPLHDPDQAWQRTGVLQPAQTYPPPTVGGEPRPGHRAIFSSPARSLITICFTIWPIKLIWQARPISSW